MTDAGERLVQLAEKVIKEVQAAERDLARIAQRTSGNLRIALECHTCFDWLMPIMDSFRKHWPEVKLDVASGFHTDPIRFLKREEADIVISSENKPQRDIVHYSLFRFEILAMLAPGHELAKKEC